MATNLAVAALVADFWRVPGKLLLSCGVPPMLSVPWVCTEFFGYNPS